MSAEPGQNPFRPAVGIRPPVLAGRDGELRRFNRILLGAPELPANVRLTGLRGVGKTVLLREYRRIGRELGWRSASLEIQPRHTDATSFLKDVESAIDAARREIDRAGRVREGLSKIKPTLTMRHEDIEITLAAIGVPAERDVATALAGAASKALDQDWAGLLITLDEAQLLRDDRKDRNTPLASILTAVSTLQQQTVPIALVMAGLPTLLANLQAARTYSERLFRGERIGALTPPADEDALVTPFRSAGIEVDEDVAREVLRAVQGYPYFIQLWGAELYDAAVDARVNRISRPLLEASREHIQHRLDADFFEPRLATLTPAEADVLASAAHCEYPPLVVREVAKRSPKSFGNVNVLVGRLVAAGVIYWVRKGEYEYTAPGMHEFLGRRFP